MTPARLLKPSVLALSALIVGMLALLMAPGTALAEVRLALVVGNGAYKTGPLRNPGNDASSVGSALEASGFTVTTLVDADREAMKRGIRAFAETLRGAGEDSVAVFYYAGHGVQVKGRNYLVPLKAELTSAADVEFETIEAQWVLDLIGDSRAGLSVIILDACRNNPFRAISRSADRGLARMDAPRGSILAYSTAPGEVALDGEGTNSPYTAALAKAMRVPGLKIEEMFKQVRREVLAATGDRQIPWESSSLIGDFYFSGSAGVTTAALTPQTPQAAPVSPGKSFRDCPDCPEMKSVAGGRFLLGSASNEPGRTPPEGPQIEVSLRPYAIGTNEVTIGQFRRFVEETGHKMHAGCWHWALTWLWDTGRTWQNPGWKQTDRHPIMCTTWHDAAAYAEWLSAKTGQRYRLPSEAEWEFAAGGGEGRAPWGTNPDLACLDANIYDRSMVDAYGAWYSHAGCADAFAESAPVGSLKPNQIGIYDMIGNAWEWTQDCWNAAHTGHPDNGAARQTGDCNLRVRKGGSFASPAEWYRPAWREGGVAKDPNIYGGFRVARDM